MTLSVIVPVYKVEKTLDRCVKSILDQEVPDMEVILVDDGSPDNCPAMCDAWKERDERIKVIHKENGGLSDARNAGLDIAEGFLVTFVDSDDHLMPNTYLPLMRMIQLDDAVDILEYNIHQTDPSRLPLEIEKAYFPTAKQYWLETKGWNHSYVFNKIFRRRLFKTTRFDKGRLFEDLRIMPELLKMSRKVMTTAHGTYVYSFNEEGISKHTDKHTTLELLKAEISAAKTMRTWPWSKNGHNLYYYMLCRLVDLV